MAVFNVSAWFYVDIALPGDPESDEYQEALDEIIENLGCHATLITSYDTYLTNNLEVDSIDSEVEEARLIWEKKQEALDRSKAARRMSTHEGDVSFRSNP